MEKHHKNSINNLVKEFKKDNSILALILGGSIAHGFAKTDSDIDVSIVVETNEYQKRKKENNLVYVNKNLCTYENGYIDGKYMDCEFLKSVASKGSDPARFAFKDNSILFSRIDNLEKILSEILRYPVEKKEDRINRFASQLLAWKWYYNEAIRQQNQYLIYLSIQKIVLFSSRIIFVVNEMFYPYHKWMLRVIQKADKKPDKMQENIGEILKAHSKELINDYCTKILTFINIDEKSFFWPNQFIKDSEINWLNGEPPVDDL